MAPARQTNTSRGGMLRQQVPNPHLRGYPLSIRRFTPAKMDPGRRKHPWGLGRPLGPGLTKSFRRMSGT
eukprot:4401156-Pyramimonas_sp.AAC.1